MSGPVEGKNVLGSSAYTRASTACPSSATTSGRIAPSRSPAADRIIAATRSTPVTISVTACSTCSRVFTSRKLNVPSAARSISTVPILS